MPAATRRSPEEIADELIKKIRSRKDKTKISWGEWVAAVVELSGVSDDHVELVLRASTALCDVNSDFDCYLSNEIYNLDANWEKWDPRPNP